MTTQRGVLYQEQQRFRRRWLWATVLLMMAVPAFLASSGAFQEKVLGLGPPGRPFDRHVLGAILVGVAITGVAVIWVGLTGRLTTEVHHGFVLVRFSPLMRKPQRIDLIEVARHEAVTYSPLRDYGGWGIRGFKRNRAYNIAGDRGVKLYFLDGRRLLIGSQRADALSDAISRARA